MKDKNGIEINLGDYIQIIAEWNSKGRVTADDDGEWFLDNFAKFYLKNYKPEELEILHKLNQEKKVYGAAYWF